jgi:hypothetical protein
MNRVWVSFWDGALGDAELGASETARYERWRGRLREHVRAAHELGEITADIDDVVVTASAFTHGLVVQTLFDQDRFPPERQIELLDRFLGTLRSPTRPPRSTGH